MIENSDTQAHVPDEIGNETQVFDIAFHPFASYIAIGQVSGQISIYRLSSADSLENELVLSNSRHKSSCRGLFFGEDGQSLYSISSDKSILCLDSSGKRKFHWKKAHQDAINKIIPCETTNFFVTGDDSGTVKIWDPRLGSNEVMSWSLHEEFISGFSYHQDSQTLLSVGGDGCLAVYDLRNQSNHVKSDSLDVELGCVEHMKDGRTVICGSDDGAMFLFGWARWGDCNDRLLGHNEGVNSILKVDESTILTGSDDGKIRLVSIHPNKIVGEVGEQVDLPVECLRVTHDKSLLAYYSHNEIVRFYDMATLLQEVDETREDADENLNASTFASVEAMNVDTNDSVMEEMDDYCDVNEEEDDDDDDSSEDEENNRRQGGRRKLLTASQKFFADL